MSTAAFPGVVRRGATGEFERIGIRESEPAEPFTIRRITRTHHGRTLQTLGRAAEYLVESRRFTGGMSAGYEEAVGLLMRLSSTVFREYAAGEQRRYPVEDFLMGCAAWLFE
jgi:hypothetical protein